MELDTSLEGACVNIHILEILSVVCVELTECKQQSARSKRMLMKVECKDSGDLLVLPRGLLMKKCSELYSHPMIKDRGSRVEFRSQVEARRWWVSRVWVGVLCRCGGGSAVVGGEGCLS